MIPRRLIPIITFSIILLLSLAQIFWWVYFQIRQTKTVVSLHSQVGVLWEEKIEHELDNAVRRHHRAAGARNDFDHASFIRDWMATNAAEYEWDSIAFAASGKILIHSKQQQIVLDEANRRLVMFISEGAFFSIMVLAGIYFLYYTFKKEIQLQVLQTNFILSVTHELRSPLASIKLYLQSLLRSNVPDQKREMFLKHGLEDADRLHRLLENLLNAARMEEKKVIYHKRPIDLSQTNRSDR